MTLKNKDQRVAVFIDVQNLYHSAKNLYQARVNFGEVLKSAVAGRHLVRRLDNLLAANSLSGALSRQLHPSSQRGAGLSGVLPTSGNVVFRPA